MLELPFKVKHLFTHPKLAYAFLFNWRQCNYDGQEEVQTSKFMELISYMNRVERCFKETLSKPKLQLVIFKQVYNL